MAGTAGHFDEKMTLSAHEIDRFSDILEERLVAIDMERDNRFRVRLSMEEALLRMRDRFGEDQTVRVRIGRRLGKFVIQVDLEGEAYNPLSDEENELADLCGTLVTAAGLSPQYSYDGRINTLRLPISYKVMNPVQSILICVIGGILFGVLGSGLIPEATRQVIAYSVIEPFYQLWYRILNVISGPVIFLAVVTAILNSYNLSVKGGSSRRSISRYFILNLVMSGATLALAMSRYPLTMKAAELNAAAEKSFLQTILEFVPNDFITPFLESDTPQLLVMALVIGTALNALNTQTINLTRMVRQVYICGLQVAEWISRLVPFAAGILIGYAYWKGKEGIFGGLLKCILFSLIISVIFIVICLLYVSRKEHITAGTLLKKTGAPFWVTLKTGSLDASFGQTEQSCVSQLGMNRSFVLSSLPNGLVFYMPVSSIGIIVFLAYSALKYDISVTPSWYIRALLLSVILFVATVPVPGANLLAYMTMFAQLGIPKAALIDAMIFDIVFGFFANAANQMLLQFDLVLQADRIGLLDKDRLRRIS